MIAAAIKDPTEIVVSFLTIGFQRGSFGKSNSPSSSTLTPLHRAREGAFFSISIVWTTARSRMRSAARSEFRKSELETEMQCSSDIETTSSGPRHNS